MLLASGGFSNNVQMSMSHDPRLNEKFDSTNHPGATGEMIQAAQEIGANTIQMDWIQMGPWTSPDDKGFGLAPLFVESALGYGLWPRVHHCMGGLEINDNAEVLSCRGKPIEGLYAAGEVTGGVHGMVRLGTVAVADCMIFGRVAARQVAAKK